MTDLLGVLCGSTKIPIKIILLELAWVAFIFVTVFWQSRDGEKFAWSFIVLAWIGTFSFEFSKEMPIGEANQTENIEKGLLWMALARLISLTCITAQIILTMYAWNNKWVPMVETIGNIPDDFWKFTVLAYIASGFYTLSGLGIFIILLQWGMNLDKNCKRTLMLYVFHDIFMGIIWLFLCSSFSDLFDDSDDTEWRVVFSSMVIGHVLSMLFGIFSNSKYKLNCMEEKTEPRKGCWNNDTAPAFLAMSKFAMYVLIYHSILTRLHDNDTMLIKMGFSDFGDIEIYIACGVLMFVNAFEFYTPTSFSGSGSKYIPSSPKRWSLRGSRLKF